ncbi:MAG: hypothetical protein IGS03_07275 [Candidatus Sericytochromatia bacterium]|nr:hypothetical protein [Candidatus Sericytochromatia bacterium]
MNKTAASLFVIALALTACNPAALPATSNPGNPATPAQPSSEPADPGLKVAFADVEGIVQQRCISCHSANPFPQGGISFDNPADIQARASRIRLRVVQQRNMPPGNSTGMTDAERELLGRWIEQGASRD